MELLAERKFGHWADTAGLGDKRKLQSRNGSPSIGKRRAGRIRSHINKNRVFTIRIRYEYSAWLGWRDSNPRDDGVKVRCLTAWRQPNVQFLQLRKYNIFPKDSQTISEN